jgi:hypothetical protein
MKPVLSVMVQCRLPLESEQAGQPLEIELKVSEFDLHSARVGGKEDLGRYECPDRLALTQAQGQPLLAM